MTSPESLQVAAQLDEHRAPNKRSDTRLSKVWSLVPTALPGCTTS